MAFIYNLSDAWNDAGTTFTSIKMNVLDTASNAASLLMDLQVGGVSQFKVSKAGVTTTNGAMTTGGSATIGGNVNLPSVANNVNWGSTLVLLGDAANILAQRNGVNAQISRIYRTYTDASNYERWVWGDIDGGGSWLLHQESSGTGTIRNLAIRGGTPGIARSVSIQNASITTWTWTAAGHYLAGTDNTYDIGASGANRPRNLYMASWIRMATTTVASLPAAATAGAGARMFVTDAASPTFGSAVTGGGAVTVPVYSTGSAWNVG
jgi:hypothetical protein